MSKYRLPVLTELVIYAEAELQINFKNTLFVCVQHLLGTTVNLFESLIELGAKSENIYLLGKHYSQSLVATHELLQLGIYLQPISQQTKIGEFAPNFAQDVKALWSTVLKNLNKKKISTIIILDDGGHCLSATPRHLISKYPLIGIEQTTAGLANLAIKALPFPVIEVASSAAKQVLESPIIANAVANKVNHYLPRDSNSQLIGVIGVGAIGQAVINKLQSLNHEIIAFDNRHSKVNTSNSLKRADTIEQLIQNADIVFGCTGTDVFSNLRLDEILVSDKLLISCSSEDKEFLSLLNHIQNDSAASSEYSPLADINFLTVNNKKITILRGGFPINFDHFKEVEPPEDIQLTRGLLLCATFQAYLYSKRHNAHNRIMLHPLFQHLVVKIWLDTHPKKIEHKLITNFFDLDWIANYSGGFLQHYSETLGKRNIKKTPASSSSVKAYRNEVINLPPVSMEEMDC